MMSVSDLVRSPSVSLVIHAATAALLLGFPPTLEARQLTTGQTVCTGDISGTVGTLIVPSGAVCTSVNLVVNGDIVVQRDATLRISGGGQCLVAEPGTLITRGGIRVAAGGTLLVSGTNIEIGGDVMARRALGVSVAKTPCVGARGIVRGNIVVGNARAVGISGLQIEDSVFVTGSGDEGLEVGANAVAGTLFLQNNTIVGAESPSIFAVHFNTVGRGLVIVANDATRAIEPPLVGGNTVVKGNLLCANNVPAPTNRDVDTTMPNTVLNGAKLGQCAGL